MPLDPPTLDEIALLANSVGVGYHVSGKLMGVANKTLEWLSALALLQQSNVNRIRLAVEFAKDAHPGIEPMMVLSTAHIDQETAAELESKSDLLDLLPYNGLITANTQYGWLIYCAPDSTAEQFVEQHPMSECLWSCIHYARERGCPWLLLDQDVGVLDDLEQFDWS
jgi:hypothetical protein